jgi:hypothetical protein
MTRNKLHVRWLMLAPGALRLSSSDEEVDASDEEASHIHDNEQLHRAWEVAIESSLPRRTGPQLHGIDDRFVGRFWATGNDSDSEPKVEQEDQPDRRLKVNVANSNLVVERFCVQEDPSYRRRQEGL